MRRSAATLLFVCAFVVQLQAQPSTTLPALAPAYGELPPTFWEQHGYVLIAVVLLVLVIVAIIVVLALRPKQAVVVPPEIEARRALEDLRSRAEDGAVLSRVSQTIRRYFITVFALPPGEYTTAEFCRTLSARKEIGTDLSAGVADFLRACDERKFSASPQSSPSGASTRALELVGQAEARRAQLKQQAGASRVRLATTPAFSLSSPEGGEGRGEEAKDSPNQCPSPQPSPRLGGERESDRTPRKP